MSNTKKARSSKIGLLSGLRAAPQGAVISSGKIPAILLRWNGPPDALTLRHATRSDLAAVDARLARGYPRLLAADYAASVLVTAVPIIARARPELLASGRNWRFRV